MHLRYLYSSCGAQGSCDSPCGCTTWSDSTVDTVRSCSPFPSCRRSRSTRSGVRVVTARVQQKQQQQQRCLLPVQGSNKQPSWSLWAYPIAPWTGPTGRMVGSSLSLSLSLGAVSVSLGLQTLSQLIYHTCICSCSICTYCNSISGQFAVYCLVVDMLVYLKMCLLFA